LYHAVRNAQCPMPNAQCAMPNAETRWPIEPGALGIDFR
jgi:hypothetical protein